MDLELLPVQLHSVSGKAVVLNKYPNEGATSLISVQIITTYLNMKFVTSHYSLVITFVITVIFILFGRSIN